MRLLIFFALSFQLVQAAIPIQFAIPEVKIVEQIPEKERDFAFIIPGKLETYIYNSEEDYYRDYQKSYFAVTCRKGGWDCLRHYEILANGCIPYFVDLEQCPPNTMFALPKELILEAMHLKGVSYLHIDHDKFDKAKYFKILKKLLDYTRKHLTTKSMAAYLLNQLNYHGEGKILYLSQDPYPDYMRCVMLIGLKELLGARVVDFPKIDHIYKTYPKDEKRLYGKGFSYTKIVDDPEVDRTDLADRINKKEFDLIIYGSVHRGMPFHALVLKNYQEHEIAYLCGEDGHKCEFSALPNLFIREFDCLN